MKKLALSLIASLVFVQSSYAFVELPTITSNLGSSLRIYEAIIEAIETTFAGVIPQNEFVVEIEKRKKQAINLNVAHDEIWIIKTVFRAQRNFLEDVNPELSFDNVESNIFGSRHPKTHKYEAVVRITPNPSIGPPLIQVLSITRASKHESSSHLFAVEDRQAEVSE
jgi:hypothetical protein